MNRVGDVAFKALTAGLGVATLFLTVTFSINVYRGLSWHSAQSITGHAELVGYIQHPHLKKKPPALASALDTSRVKTEQLESLLNLGGARPIGECMRCPVENHIWTSKEKMKLEKENAQE